jgi:polyisoprenoid-binding protein YceI
MTHRFHGPVLAALAAMMVAGPVMPPPARAQAPATEGARLELTEGSQVRYRVREQLAGINFPSGVTGTLILGPDGQVVSQGSKLTLDLRTFKSDQDMRDGFIQRRTLQTEKFPLAEFIPRRVVGLPYPFPSEPPAQAGFQLIGDMTMHGVTTEITWNVVATFAEGRVSGLATTSFPFSKFNLEKPSLARLISVDDTINLEMEFRARTTSTTR